MMKSFFKKLAFVMALAMVVSMVAPAGSALAAEAGVSLQGTKTIVKTYELEKAGDSQDFSFQGAPKDWKTTSKWTSSNEAVATVDKMGVVTAVAAGTATITITSGADKSYAESVVVTVKEEKKADAFTVEQADLTKFTMTFDAKKDVKAEDVAVVLMISDVEAPIPVKEVSVKENVATVELFSEFIDGVTYKVTYGKETEEFVGSIGAIDKVAFTYATDDVANVAYVSTEDEPSVAVLNYVLYDANGVDVTSAYDEDELTVEYTVVNEDEDFEILDNELVFYEAGAAVVEVKVTWTSDDDGDEIEKVGNGVVVATKRPAIAHNLVEAGFIAGNWYLDGAVDDFTTNKDSVFWKNNSYLNSWVLGDGGTFQFAALVKDNRGNTVVTGINEYGTSYTIDEETEEEIYPYGYFKFATSNDEVVDIDEYGEVSFWGAGSASIITYFVDCTGEDEKEVFVGATKISVSPKRVPTTYAIADTSASVAVKSSDAKQNLAAFTLTVFDQYGKNIALKGDTDAITVEPTSDADNIPTECYIENSKATTKTWNVDEFVKEDDEFVLDDDGNKIPATSDCSGWWCGNSQGDYHYHITFDGDDFAEYLGTKTSKTVQYAVTIDKDENSKITTSGTAKIKLTVKNTVEYADALNGVDGKTTNDFYYSVSGGDNVDLAVTYKKDFSQTWAQDLKKSKEVSMNYMDKSKNFTMKSVGNNIALLNEEQTTGDAGVLYYELSTPKDAKNYVFRPDWGKVVFEWNEADDNNVIQYATTGTYKVTVYYVKNTSVGTDGTGKLSKLGTYTYNVSNSQAAPKFAGYDSKLGNKSTEVFGSYNSTTGEFEYVDADIIEIIQKNMKFSVDGATIDWEDGFELELKDVVVTAKKIRVNKVTVKVPIEGTSYFYKKDVTVGKTIYHAEEEE